MNCGAWDRSQAQLLRQEGGVHIAGSGAARRRPGRAPRNGPHQREKESGASPLGRLTATPALAPRPPPSWPTPAPGVAEAFPAHLPGTPLWLLSWAPSRVRHGEGCGRKSGDGIAHTLRARLGLERASAFLTRGPPILRTCDGRASSARHPLLRMSWREQSPRHQKDNLGRGPSPRTLHARCAQHAVWRPARSASPWWPTGRCRRTAPDPVDVVGRAHSEVKGARRASPPSGPVGAQACSPSWVPGGRPGRPPRTCRHIESSVHDHAKHKSGTTTRNRPPSAS